jgi:hypothetical protein
MLHAASMNPGPNLGGGHNGIAFAGLLLIPLAFSRRARQAILKGSLSTLALALFALLVTGEFSGCSGGSSTPSAQEFDRPLRSPCK